MRKAVYISAALYALLALASPVGAQHAEHYECEPNDTPAQANRVTMQSSVIGQALLGDADYFALPTPEHLATYQIHVQIYTPHPPLPCDVTVVVRDQYGRVSITRGRNIDYTTDWTGLYSHHYIGIWSTCEDLHYQIDFSRVRGAHTTYLPTIGGGK